MTDTAARQIASGYTTEGGAVTLGSVGGDGGAAPVSGQPPRAHRRGHRDG
mgnify:CR=1 FL=1